MQVIIVFLSNPIFLEWQWNEKVQYSWEDLKCVTSLQNVNRCLQVEDFRSMRSNFIQWQSTYARNIKFCNCYEKRNKLKSMRGFSPWVDSEDKKIMKITNPTLMSLFTSYIGMNK